MIIFPCADCDRDLPAVPTDSDYECPCGAHYVLMEHHCEGIPGIVVLLLPCARGELRSRPCSRCRVELPDVAFPTDALFVDSHGAVNVVQYLSGHCRHCGAEHPTPVDPEAAPRWRRLRAAAAAARN